MRKYHISIFIITLVAIGVWFFLFNYVSPFDGERINGFILLTFLASLGIGIAGVVALILYRVKIFFHPVWDARTTTRNCIRQGSLVGGGVVFIVLLTIINTLTPVTASLTVVSLVLLEYFFRR